MADANDLIEDSPKHLSRRNVVVGTAWAVPVVMGVGATPAFAASSISGVTAVVSVTSKKVTFDVTVVGYTAGDTVSVSIDPSDLTWTGTDPTGSHLLTGSTTTIIGNFKDKAHNPPVVYTATFSITSGSNTFTKVASFTW